jgi:hypothetical protein
MKIVTLSGRSQEVNRLLKLAKKEDVVIRTRDGEEFMVSLVNEFDVEIARQRKNKKLMSFLDERFRDARMEPGIPLEDMKRQLGLPKNSRNSEKANQGRRGKK